MRTLRSLMAAVLTVVMIACLSVSAFAAYEEITYDDVSEMYGTTLSGVNTIYIKFADKLGLVPSMTDGSFNPNGLISRIDALKIAYRMLHYDYDELSEYSSTNTDFDEAEGGDISDVYMLKTYIAWAQDYQLINSEYVPDNKFEPNKAITGVEFITLLAKVMGIATNESTVEDYEAALEIVLMDSDVTVDSETINREQAAVIVARAMLYDPEYGDVNEDMYVNFSDYDISCLGTNVYGCHNTQLTVRATKQRPMGYEGVTSDVLFSNGAQVDVGADLSAFVGYQMDVVYMDKDGSGTFTQDEEIITYQMVSPWVTTVSLSDVSFESYAAIKATSSQGAIVKLQTNSLLYLNDNLWPTEDIYDLVKLAGHIEFSPNTTTKPATAIKNRPNLEFTFIQQTSAELADVVLATEWIPGKIMTVTDDYLGIYSYYDGETYVYEDNFIEMTNLVNPKAGDYVNFYLANNKMYLTEGATAYLTEYSAGIDANGNEVLNGTVGEESLSVIKHLFCQEGDNTVAGLGRRPVVAVMDSTRKSYIALEEPAATDEILIEIISATTDDDIFANVEATVVATGEKITLNDVKIANITSLKGIVDKGGIFTYYKTEGGAYYMHGVDPVEMTVIEMDDYFITEGGVKYLKTSDYVSSESKPINGEAILTIDRYNGVRAAEAVA
ncbi:MAG: S-layer homology domain-containing protein [Clostridia bacterium]|nr:S-layer homology domain-containing protein [Clostridia bacterium]